MVKGDNMLNNTLINKPDSKYDHMINNKIRKNTNKNKIKEGSLAFNIALYTLAGFFALIAIYPMYYVMIMSISKPMDVAARNVYLFPTGFVTSAYSFVLKDPILWSSFKNSVLYVILTTIIKIVLCVLAAYPLSMPRLAGRKYVVWFLLIPMYFSGGMIPSFLNITNLGLYNSIWAVVLPASVAIWHIILTRTYFTTSIPNTLREAAMIDGANHYKTLFNIYLPLAKPILAVIAIYTIVSVWNSWFSATIYLPDPKKHPLQMYLKKMLVDNTQFETYSSIEEAEQAIVNQMVKMQLQYAVIVITTVPILMVYPFLQKYFVKGIMIGSLKG